MHPDDPQLNAHVAAGWRIDKAARADKIDAVVASTMALDRLEKRPAPAQLLGWLLRRPCLTCGTLSDGSYCGRSDTPLEVHHFDGNPMNNRIPNTIPLCLECHHDATFPGI